MALLPGATPAPPLLALCCLYKKIAWSRGGGSEGGQCWWMGTTPSPAPPPEPGTGDPRRILLRRDRGHCREEEAGTLLPSCALAELPEPGASYRGRVVRAPLGELGTHPLALCLAPSRGIGEGGRSLHHQQGEQVLPPPLFMAPRGLPWGPTQRVGRCGQSVAPCSRNWGLGE